MRSISFLIIFGLFSSTHLTPEQKLIKETLGETVDIDIFESIWQGEREIPFGEFRDKYPFLSIVYLEDACSPCYPRFLEWQTGGSGGEGICYYCASQFVDDPFYGPSYCYIGCRWIGQQHQSCSHSQYVPGGCMTI